MKKCIVLTLSLFVAECYATPKSGEFLVDTITTDKDVKIKKLSKQKLKELREEIAFASINSLEAIFFHIDQAVAQEGDNSLTITSLNRTAQQILSCCRQWVEQDKHCFMTLATQQSLSSLLAVLKKLQRSMGQVISEDWAITVEKNIKKICNCDTIKTSNK